MRTLLGTAARWRTTSGTGTCRSCWGAGCRPGRSTSPSTAACWWGSDELCNYVLCKMLYIVCPKVNSFALRADNNGEEENVGTALYRANSIFDHSCAPNATTIFSGDVKIIACTCIYYKLMFRQEAVHKVGGVQSEDGAEQLLHLLPGPVHDQASGGRLSLKIITNRWFGEQRSFYYPNIGYDLCRQVSHFHIYLQCLNTVDT